MSTKLEQVRQIVFKAVRGPGRSRLSSPAIDTVGGYTSPNIRHLLNNLGEISTSYYEIGSHRGATLISATYDNYGLKSSIGCDNFSQFNEQGSPEPDFWLNCNRFIKDRFKLFKFDCFDVKPDDIAYPIDLFFSDGSHSYQDQKRAITHMAPMLDNECVVLVDDFSWHDTNAGTMDGFKEAGLSIEFAWTLFSGNESDCGPNGWWNGLGVFVVRH